MWPSVVAARALQGIPSTAVVPGLGGSAAPGIFPDRGSNQCLLHRRAQFFTTKPPGKPFFLIFIGIIIALRDKFRSYVYSMGVCRGICPSGSGWGCITRSGKGSLPGLEPRRWSFWSPLPHPRGPHGSYYPDHRSTALT